MWLDFGIVCCLFFVTVRDIKKKEIPNRYVGILLLFCGMYALEQKADGWRLLLGTLVFAGMLFVFYAGTNGKGIGGSDIKLLFAGGLRLGFTGISIAFLTGAFSGCLVQWVRYRFFGKEKDFPMGPWLSAGMVLVMIGQRVIGRIGFF